MSGKINRCYFCGGNISDGYCIMCGRSDDVKHELYVMEEQKKPHRNLHTCKRETERLSRSGGINLGGYGRRNHA
jgi:ribosomal protein L24E